MPGSDEVLTSSNAALRRALRWQKPPQWSRGEWLGELEAEANLAMLRALLSYEPSYGVPLSAFVYKSVLHGLWSVYRREWQYALHVYSGNQLIEKDNLPVSSPVEAERLQEALQALPDRERAVIWQVFYNGSSEREVAEELGIAATVVHRLKKRALQRLRELLCGGGS